MKRKQKNRAFKVGEFVLKLKSDLLYKWWAGRNHEAFSINNIYEISTVYPNGGYAGFPLNRYLDNERNFTSRYEAEDNTEYFTKKDIKPLPKLINKKLKQLTLQITIGRLQEKQHFYKTIAKRLPQWKKAHESYWQARILLRNVLKKGTEVLL